MSNWRRCEGLSSAISEDYQRRRCQLPVFCNATVGDHDMRQLEISPRQWCSRLGTKQRALPLLSSVPVLPGSQGNPNGLTCGMASVEWNPCLTRTGANMIYQGHCFWLRIYSCQPIPVQPTAYIQNKMYTSDTLSTIRVSFPTTIYLVR